MNNQQLEEVTQEKNLGILISICNDLKVRGGSTLGPGGTGPPNVGQPPQIFWFQQQKYVFLKSRLFLYSGEINTRIS